MFFASGSNNHGIYNVFGPRLAKTLVFTQFSACCKKNFFHAKGTMFWLLASARPKTANIRQKVPKMDLQKASCNFIGAWH